MREKKQGTAYAHIQIRTENDKKCMSSAAQRTHSGAVSITETGAAGSEVVDPHHSPLFTRQELVRAARSGGHLEGEGGKGRERGVGRRGWGGGRGGGRGGGEGVGGWIGYTLMHVYTCTCTCIYMLLYVKKQ